MKRFGDFCSDFVKYRSKLKEFFGDDYIWALGKECQGAWWNDFEERVPDATEEEIESFHRCLSFGGNLLGIYVGAVFEGNEVRLYRKSQVTKSFSVGNIIFRSSSDILGGLSTLVTVDGIQIDMPFVIKKNTVYVSSPIRMIDFPTIDKFGLVCSEHLILSGTVLLSEAILASLNYRTGLLEIVQSGSNNEHLILDLYEPRCIKEEGNSGSEGGSQEPYPAYPPLDRVGVSGYFTAYCGPFLKVYSYSCI